MQRWTQTMTQLNYYKILRLKPSATPKEIDLAFRNLQALYDNNKNSPAEEIMELIDEAYAVLHDPNSRANYDMASLVEATETGKSIELTEAEIVVNTWGEGYTVREQEYLDGIESINKIVRIVVIFLAIVFVWSVITFRWDISGLMILFGVLLRIMFGSIYRIKNPPPPIEVWANK